MILSRSYLGMEERRENDGVRLILTGELDLDSAPGLQHRLNVLRSQRLLVRLDLSKLEFVDSSGVHLLVGAVQAAREDGWRLEVDRRLSPQVERVFALLRVTEFFAETG